MAFGSGLALYRRVFLLVLPVSVLVVILLYIKPFGPDWASYMPESKSVDGPRIDWLSRARNKSARVSSGSWMADVGKSDSIPDNFGRTDFDINGSDVIVYLHMQKTGGTSFGRHLISNVKLEKECDILSTKKRRDCMRPSSENETWIFSRFSTGWACGLHADWTELTECVEEKLNSREQHKSRRYFYITLLRDPVRRYISEWKHVQRGATWKSSTYGCNGDAHELPKCYSGGESWKGVSLNEFMSCPFNMANNRQTRMLANLSLVNCYERWLNTHLDAVKVHDLEETMLESAKKNLQEMSFFGLLEDQRKLQTLFEYTFPLEFKKSLMQFNLTRTTGFFPTAEELQQVKKLNQLDLELYGFASRLFAQRYREMEKT